MRHDRDIDPAPRARAATAPRWRPQDVLGVLIWGGLVALLLTLSGS